MPGASAGHSLADRVLDALALGAQPLALLPAHLHKHLVADVLHRQLELLILGVVGLAALLWGDRCMVWAGPLHPWLPLPSVPCSP